MTKIKPSDLIGLALDWAVAKHLDGKAYITNKLVAFRPTNADYPVLFAHQPTVPSVGRLLNEKHVICLNTTATLCGVVPLVFCVTGIQRALLLRAITPLIAAYRCYVASKVGNTIEIPERLKWN